MTQYSRADITPEIIAYIRAHLWDRGKEEFARLGMTVDDAFSRLPGFLQYECHALCADVPVLICGYLPDAEGWCTWFQATDDFTDHALGITRFLKTLVKDRHDTRIYSVLVHPDSERWFKAIGFLRDGWHGRTPAGFPLYRFSRG